MAKDYVKSFSIGFVQGFGVTLGGWVASKVIAKIEMESSKKKMAPTAEEMEGFRSMVHDSTKSQYNVKKANKVQMGFH